MGLVCGGGSHWFHSIDGGLWGQTGPLCKPLDFGTPEHRIDPYTATQIPQRRRVMRLANKVALISGGARGMGATEAKLFAIEGAKVVIGDILEEEGRQTEAEITETGGECLFIRLDGTSESDWQRAVAATAARFGKLDVLVNNAGIFRRHTTERSPYETIPR